MIKHMEGLEGDDEISRGIGAPSMEGMVKYLEVLMVDGEICVGNERRL